MINKEHKQKKQKQKTRYLSRIITLIFALTFIFSLCINVFANGSFRVENCNKCEDYSAKLGNEISDFVELDVHPQKEVSSYVADAINNYRKELFDLQSHPDIEKRSLESEILLAYTKGSTAGQIAWIYYYNIYTFASDLSANKISAKYESFKSDISSATQHTVLDAECEIMLNELNKLIYTERAKNLSLPTDSLTSSSLISGSIDKFKNFNCPDLFAKDYADEYESLVEALGLQRVRDALSLECENVFKSIRPSESFSTSSDVSLLIHKLETATSIKLMNNAALDFTKDLMAIDEKKPYSSSAKKEYLALVQTAVSRGTESGSAAKLTEIFTDYTLNIKKAETKDSIYALFLGNGDVTDESLISLEKSYNSNDGIIDSCKNDAEAEAALLDAKADLFKSKHANIISKQFDSLTKQDESLAKSALIEYTSLEGSVKQRLLTEINIIAEKYNNILIKKMRDLLPNDALYLDLCENIEKEIKETSRENIDDFYNKVSRIPQKAEALATVIKEYRSILGEEDYKSYEESEKDELLKSLSKLSEDLASINPADIAIYSGEINYAQSSAIRSLNITNQTARVRIATHGSKNSEILKELTSAAEKIKLCSDKSEMSAQAEIAIYKIQRILTSDEIAKCCNDIKNAISAMQFLEKNEKESFINKIEALSPLSKDAKEAENIAALENIWKGFSESIEKIKAEAKAIDLSRAITSYLEKVASSTKERNERLNSLKYISKNKSDEIYNKILELEKKANADIPSLKSTAEVSNYYLNFLKSLDNLMNQANESDLEGYKILLLSEFKKYEESKANYSDENYNKILAIKQNAEKKLKSATTKDESDNIITAALNEALLVNDLLDDEKENALASLLVLLDKLKKESNLYSAESFSKIEGLYEEGKLEIGKISEIQNISKVKTTLSKYLSLMKGINKDSIYTSNEAHSITTPSLQYPQDYDYSKGLLGSVYLKGNLISDAKLTINIDELLEKNKIEKMIRKAAKKGTLVTYQELPDGTLKMLRSASVMTALDISLSSVAENAAGYTFQMLIPNELSTERVLGLAFINGDEVEFYPADQQDSLITTELQHFSKYYIVVESTLNVRPLLIALVILLGIEFLVLIAIIYLKRKRDIESNEDPENNSNLPTLPMSAFIPIGSALTRVYPENGITLAALLSLAALALGVTIALLIRSETRKINEQKEDKQEQKLLKGKKEQLLLESAKYTEEKDDAFFNEESPELCKVGAARKAAEVSYKEEIDLDTIAKNFKSGETVTITALKEKGLIDEKTQSIKILSKGNLTKPLTIEANEFSNAAKDALEISGGKAKTI